LVDKPLNSLLTVCLLFIVFPGEFGDVYKGEINAYSGQPATKIAIKTLKVLFMFVCTQFLENFKLD
jgi:hypothetical protein